MGAQEFADWAAIARLAAEWGLCRDTGRWERLRELFTADGEMRTTWFAGPASEFVDRSAASAGRGVKAGHVINATVADIRGDRAVADTGMVLQLRATVAGTPVDVSCHGRFHDRLVREGGVWRIRLRVPVYDKDRMDPVMPGATVALDPAVLQRFPEGYRFLAYAQSLTGAAVPPGLPTGGSEEEAALRAESAAWLAG